MTSGGPERLQKLLAAAGLGSRRECEGLVAAGRVTVDGRPASLGERADPAVQEVAVDGVPVRFDVRTVAYLLNKPAGYVTTARDPQGRPIVVDLVPAEPRVFPVGRLDRDTEGLLVLTNDGDLAHRIMHPSHGLPKTYVAEVAGAVRPATLARLRRGVDLEDGPARAATARLLARRGAESVVEVVVTEGRNRIVRRMLATVGHPVRRLARSAIGPVRDDKLAPGRFRRLTPTELGALERAAGAGVES